MRAPAGACGASADSREEAQMSIYHLSAKIFSRSDGVSIIARAAYRSGTRMTDPETGKTYDYRRKKEAVYSEISLCPNAPEQYRDRNTLWCSVQEEEHASNSQIAREIEAALPIEYSRNQQISVLKDYIEQNFTSQGMICDWTIHDKPGNPHCHNVDKRTKLGDELANFARSDDFSIPNNIILETVIPMTVKLKNTEMEHQPVNLLYPKDNIRKTYDKVIEELKAKGVF